MAFRFRSGCANCVVGGYGEGHEGIEEFLGLADEETVGGEAGDGGYGSGVLVGDGADGCAQGQAGADELGGDGEDEAWLDEGPEFAGEEVGEGQAVRCNWRDRGLAGVAGEVDPLQEVSDFIAADAEGDLKNFCA